MAACVILCGQGPAHTDAREFEVSSIKSAPPMRAEYTDSSGQQHTLFQFAPGGRFVFRNGTLRFLLATAFGLKEFQILGLPSWADSDRYDIDAKAATDTSPDGMLPWFSRSLPNALNWLITARPKRCPCIVWSLEGTDIN
jgi:uncharacterized protein (TIGR03435 family)